MNFAALRSTIMLEPIGYPLDASDPYRAMLLANSRHCQGESLSGDNLFTRRCEVVSFVHRLVVRGTLMGTTIKYEGTHCEQLASRRPRRGLSVEGHRVNDQITSPGQIVAMSAFVSAVITSSMPH